MLPKPNDIFERKYRILKVLGRGAFGEVFHARVDEIEREVAIKILKPQQALDGQWYDEELEARHKLREVAHKMLAKPLATRFQSAAETIEALNTVDLEDAGTCLDDMDMDETVTVRP